MNVILSKGGNTLTIELCSLFFYVLGEKGDYILKNYAFSDTTGQRYDLDDAIRIVNLQQSIWYLKNNVKLYDVYPSKDFKTNRDIVVFIFSRKASKDAYDKWCKYETDNLGANM